MYCTAAVCEEGHVIGAMYKAGQLPPKFCTKHGKRVYTACQDCRTKIRGAPYTAVSAPGFKTPDYCPECSKPYPWRLTALQRAQDEIDRRAAANGVNDGDVQPIKAFVNDLAAGTATDEQAQGVRAILKNLGPVGPVLWDQLKDFGARVLADMAKP